MDFESRHSTFLCSGSPTWQKKARAEGGAMSQPVHSDAPSPNPVRYELRTDGRPWRLARTIQKRLEDRRAMISGGRRVG